MTRTAVVHDWLDTYAGSERVLEQILKEFPGSDLFAVVDNLEPDERGFLGGQRAHTTFIQRLPLANRAFRAYLPLMPFAIEQIDLSAYDIVISSSHAVAKGVITSPDQLHVSYVHSPMRYVWDLQHEYLRGLGRAWGPRSLLSRYLFHRLRRWDVQSSHSVDGFVANSTYIARRIRKVYRRRATVIHPPVDVESFPVSYARGDTYVTASRLVPYKRLDTVIEAFRSMPRRHLVVIGDGPLRLKLEASAPVNVTFLGYAASDVLRDHLQQAAAFVFPAEEDFGILPVEAMSCGTPVIGFGKGGLVDTVRDLESSKPTGILFHDRSPEAIRGAIERFEANRDRFDPDAIREHALTFSPVEFRRKLRRYVDVCWSSHFELQAATPC